MCEQYDYTVMTSIMCLPFWPAFQFTSVLIYHTTSRRHMGWGPTSLMESKNTGQASGKGNQYTISENKQPQNSRYLMIVSLWFSQYNWLWWSKSNYLHWQQRTELFWQIQVCALMEAILPYYTIVNERPSANKLWSAQAEELQFCLRPCME